MPTIAQFELRARRTTPSTFECDKLAHRESEGHLPGVPPSAITSWETRYALGEHTDAVLSELGYSKSEREALKASGP